MAQHDIDRLRRKLGQRHVELKRFSTGHVSPAPKVAPTPTAPTTPEPNFKALSLGRSLFDEELADSGPTPQRKVLNLGASSQTPEKGTPLKSLLKTIAYNQRYGH